MSTSPDEIVLTPDQKLRLAQLSDETGRRWDEVLDEALAAYQMVPDSENGSHGESFYDRAQRRRLIGCVSGGPPDLSTNPTYMEGFGKSES